MTSSPGTLIADKYRLDRVIASGGMGVVYAATHMMLERPVAVKVLRGHLSDDKKAGARLLGEARVVAGLRSDHIAQVIDVGLHDGAPFVVMELLEGCTVHEAVHKGGPFDETRAADLVIQACHGLAEAHKRGVVHRDVKPSNLFLSRDDDRETLKVIDFGVSKDQFLEKPGEGEATTTGTLLGSPSFMAPEQIRSARDVDGRADVWSLGVVLYFMLTGKRPFEAESLLELMTQIVHEAPRPLRAVRPSTSEILAAVVARCLEKEPALRFPNAAELARALAPLASTRMRALAARVPVAAAMPLREAVPETVSEPASEPVAELPVEETASLRGFVPETTTRARRPRSLVLVAGVVVGLGVGLSLVLTRPRAAVSPPAVTPSAPTTIDTTALPSPTPPAAPPSPAVSAPPKVDPPLTPTRAHPSRRSPQPPAPSSAKAAAVSPPPAPPPPAPSAPGTKRDLPTTPD